MGLLLFSFVKKNFLLFSNFFLLSNQYSQRNRINSLNNTIIFLNLLMVISFSNNIKSQFLEFSDRLLLFFFLKRTNQQVVE